MRHNQRKELALVLGGARAGKSSYAETLARQGEQTLFVATAESLDDDLRRRIRAHRARRPASWSTLEEPLELAAAIPAALAGHDTVLLDCLTVWISNLLLAQEHEAEADAETAILARAEALLDLYEKLDTRWIVVSNEVGLGVVPATELGRRYRDLLGRVNQLFAARADKVYLMVAGLPLELKGLAAERL
ncbi:MAG: bifunctional adenosylcobinamide kinase/adenosylcobinamide-phosphate guanylyltransferase [Gammaproteobacteria bacterium]|nr:bifunctional adenosylcobinamide kinase/adenosylcobinamide-phosphate guanylyltransferase [Gammaproteobacteria bacterium]MCY4338236.1 bifunctional adenosylcobinamide kinase/adenosylcobinamide-phosphate guanylyltransferase [Gammaproteobacteria bacterium]